jgi:hypothetical protein
MPLPSSLPVDWTDKIWPASSGPATAHTHTLRKIERFGLVLVIALRLQTPKYIWGGWSYYTEEREKETETERERERPRATERERERERERESRVTEADVDLSYVSDDANGNKTSNFTMTTVI